MATRVYDALLQGTLDRVWLGDEQAGAVDDAVMRVAGHVFGFSAKYDDSQGNFTYRNLTGRDENGRSLIGDLFGGFRALSLRYDATRLSVVLVTNQLASDRDGTGRAPLSKLIDSFFKPLRAPSATVSIEQQPLFDNLLEVISCTGDELRAFLASLHLDLGAESGNQVDGSGQRRVDIDALQRYLFEKRSNRGARLIERTASDILRDLGWRGRPDFANAQQFPIDYDEYEPLTGAFDALAHATASCGHGYVALLGGPGAGKSTLLQAYVDDRPDEAIIRYFAYVKDESPIEPREEARNFLHDVCKQFRDYGITTSDALLPDGEAELKRELAGALIAARGRYQTSSLRTTIIVDGLDHVGRRSNLDRPLTAVLPDPAQLGEGVTLILGSQHLNDVSPAVKSAITQNRTVNMNAFVLTLEQVTRIVLRVAPIPSNELAEALYASTAGHPLALTFALRVVRDAATTEKALKGLRALPHFGGDARRYYEVLLQPLFETPGPRRAFALLARIRRPLQQEWLVKWPATDYESIRSFAHLFRRDDDIWTFAHDSLRHYLKLKTSELMGEDNAVEDRSYHRQCADLCASSTLAMYRWEELYHRAMAGDDDAVLRLATQESFRTQYLQYRNPSHIREDLRIAAAAVARQPTAKTVWRVTLALSEVSQREYNCDPADVWKLLIRLGDIALALSASSIRESPVAGVSERLTLADAFFKAGKPSIARSLLHGVDPTRLIDRRQSQSQAFQSITDWASLFIHIHGINRLRSQLPRLVALCRSINVDTLPIGGEPEAETGTDHYFRFRIGCAGLRTQQFELAIEQLRSLRDDERPGAATLFFDLGLAIVERGPANAVQEAREWLSEYPRLNAVDPARLLSLASIIASKHTKEALRLLDLAGEESRGIDMFENPWFFGMQERVSGQLGIAMDPIVEIPLQRDYDRQDDPYPRYVFRDTIRVLNDFARERPSLEMFRRQARLLCSRFHFLLSYDPYGKRAYRLRSLQQYAIDELFGLSQRFGLEYALQMFHALFADGGAELWSIASRRDLIVRFAQHGFLIGELRSLADALDEGDDASDPSGRIQSARERIDMWLALGLNDKARNALDDILRQTIGVGYRKDYQLSDFVVPLQEFYALNDAQGLADTVWLAKCAAPLKDILEARAPQQFLKELIELSVCADPLRGIEIAQVAGEWMGALVPFCEGLCNRDDCDAAYYVLVHLIVPTHEHAERELTETLFAKPGMAALATEFAAQVRSVGSRGARQAWLNAAAWGLAITNSAIPESLLSTVTGGGNNSEQYPSPGSTPADVDLAFRGLPHFSKNRIARKLAAFDDADRLQRAINNESIDDVLLQLAVRALRNGQRSLAESVWARIAPTRNTRERGWIRILDGGGNSDFLALGTALGNVSQNEAVGSYFDYIFSSPSPQLCVAAIPGLLRALGIDNRPKDAWAECRDYLTTLLQHINVEEPPDASLATIMDWIVGSRLDHPAIALREPVRRFAAHAVAHDLLGARRWALDAIARDESAVAPLIAAANELNPGSVHPSEALLEQLAAGDGRARQALDDCGWAELAGVCSANRQPIVIVKDALEEVTRTTGLHGTQRVAILADLLDRREDEVASKGVAILRRSTTPHLPDDYLTDTEPLRMSRILARELMRELFTRGALGNLLAEGVRFYDAALLSEPYQERPQIVQSPPSDERTPISADAVLELLGSGSDPDWVVISETAEWHTSNELLETEMIVFRRGLTPPGGDTMFDLRSNLAITGSIDFPGHPIVGNLPDCSDDWQIGKWVALKPRAARAIGLRSSSSKPLTYVVDGLGDVVKTIRWRDGPFGTSERLHRGAKGLGSVLLMRLDELHRLRFFGDDLDLRSEAIVRHSNGQHERAFAARRLFVS